VVAKNDRSAREDFRKTGAFIPAGPGPGHELLGGDDALAVLVRAIDGYYGMWSEQALYLFKTALAVVIQETGAQIHKLLAFLFMLDNRRCARNPRY